MLHPAGTILFVVVVVVVVCSIFTVTSNKIYYNAGFAPMTTFYALARHSNPYAKVRDG
jgi:hypothetical protein